MMIAEILWVSVVRMCNDLIEEIMAAGYDAELRFMDWEAVANEDELDSVDLLGPSALGIIEDQAELLSSSFAIGASTVGEVGNIFRHRKLMAHVFERLRVQKQIDLLHPTSGEVIGVATIVDGTALNPLQRSALRPYQDVHVQCVLASRSGTDFA